MAAKFNKPPAGCKYSKDANYIVWFKEGQNLCRTCPFIVLASGCKPGLERLAAIEGKGRKAKGKKKAGKRTAKTAGKKSGKRKKRNKGRR